MGFSTEEQFDKERYHSPSLDYCPVYTWMWNAPVTQEQTDKQLDEMLRLGIRRFYILPMPKSFRPTSFPTPLEPSYLSEGYLDAYRYAIEQAKKRGMQVWLYDEGGWPSGSACGQVMLQDPSLSQETIRVTEREASKGEVYSPESDTEAAFFEGQRIHSGYTFPKTGLLAEYRRVRTSFPKISSADLPDVTKEGACDLFIKLTHEKYKTRFADLKASGFTALFTDEPTAPRPFPYTDEIKTLFKQQFGEEIENYLPVLMGKAKTNERSAEIKIKFFDMLSRLFCERFLDKERAWAKQNGIAFLGHLDKDDEANGSVTGGSFSLLRALRRFDVPGVDAIRRQIFPKCGKAGLCDNKFFPRYASSAAAQTDGRHALTESFAVYGCGLTYDEMRFVINFQAMRGINVFNFMIFPYGRTGYLQAGLLPHFTQNTHPDLSAFNLYAARLSYLFSLGERVANTALYAPFADGVIGEGFDKTAEAYEKAGKTLEQNHILFDVVDDDFLQQAEEDSLSFGVLAMGKAAYTTLVIPPCLYLAEESVKRIRAFVKGGGKVATTSPKIAKRIGVPVTKDLSSLPSPLPSHGGESISYAESTLKNGRIRFLMNEGIAPCMLSLPTAGTLPYLLFPASDKVYRPTEEKGFFSFTLYPGELVALLETDDVFDAETHALPQKRLTLDRFLFRHTHKLVIKEQTERLPLQEEVSEIVLPSPRPLFPKDFSGSGEYQTTFSLPEKASRALIDLGMAIGSAEVILNGKTLGVKVMPPYRFELPLAYLKESNELTVRLTNTPANEFEHTDLWAKYRPWQLGNYRKEEGVFHADSFAGGLYDKVNIYYE